MSTLDINTGQIAANANETDRSAFIRRTYTHVAGAILALAVLLFAAVTSGIAEQFYSLLGVSRYSWLIVLGLFMGVSSIASKWAHSDVSRSTQYMGLGLYTVAMAVLLSPAVFVASKYMPGALTQAVMITAALAAGITFTAFTTKKNFSFLGSFVRVGSFVILGVIAASILFGFHIGTLGMGAGVLFMGVAVLYTTSNIIHEYRTTQHVAASLALFSGLATMFHWVLNMVMSMMGGE